MTKKSFILSVVAVGVFTLVAQSAAAVLSETQKQEIRNVLGDQTIEVTEENETVVADFPEVTVQDEGGSKKKVDAYQLHLKAAGSFNGMPQYKYVTVSPLRLKSLVYSRLGLWFPSVVTEAGSFAEEASIVPALGYESGRKMQIINLRLIDEEEGGAERVFDRLQDQQLCSKQGKRRRHRLFFGFQRREHRYLSVSRQFAHPGFCFGKRYEKCGPETGTKSADAGR